SMMKINLKKINIILLTLVILFNTVSYASLVSDNDGSAFITKSEFDSLKNDFQSKLNEYNVGIDNKIDVAIAAYLAGISLASQQKLTNLITAAKKNNAKNVGFMLWATPKSTRSYGNDYCDVEAGYGVAMCYGMQQNNNRTGSGIYSSIILNNVAAWNASVGNVNYVGTAASGGAYTGKVKNKKSAYYWVNFPFASNTSDWTLKDNVRHRLHMILQAERISSRSAQNGSYASSSAIPTANIANNATITSDFTSLTQPGSKTSATQATIVDIKIEPILTQVHTWSQFDKDSDFTSENDATTNKHLDYQIAGTIVNESVAGVEYKNRDYYATAKTLTIMAKPPKSGTAGADPGYSNGFMWKGSAVASLKSWSARTNNITFSWKFNYPKYRSTNWQRLTTAYYNDLFVKPYYKYYGIPITNVTKEGTLKFTLRFNNSTTGNYTYCIMDKTFANGALPTTQNQTLNGKTYNRVLNRATVTGTSGNKDVSFTINKEVIWDKVNGDYIYVKVQPAA
ncbi:MAG: hypothetical protein II411_01605, partial [Lachnospiraceae bacterium]|nr:hypothetical protein [Lachnospiraceae bacterium]